MTRIWASRTLALITVLLVVQCASQPTTVAPAHAALPTRVGAVALGDSADSVRTALGPPTRNGVTRGVGTAEWLYEGAYLVRFGGPTDAPRDVWHVIAYERSGARTPEGFAIGDDSERLQALYAGYEVRRFSGTSPAGVPMDQYEISDGRVALLVEFAPAGRASFISLKYAGR